MKTTAIYASAMGPEERDIASRTWLEDEGEAKEDRFATRVRRKLTTNELTEKLSNLEHCELALPVTEKIIKKQWLRQIIGTAGSILSCQLIQFCLFCHRILH
jgi:hypothetical protein